MEDCDFIADIEALKHELYLFDAVVLIDQYQQQKAMTGLFPTFTSIWQRAKRLLMIDTRDIWQALEDLPESTEEGFFDGFIYHPPI